MVEMKFRDDVYLALALAISALAIYFGLYVAPAEVELGELVRVFYFHLPQAIICYLSLVISLVTAILFLVKKDPKYDAISEPAALLGLVYGATTLISGAIWANAAWGVYWNWDPRETATLILWLAYVGYFFLRMSVENPERRASVSAAFNVLAFMTVPLSYLSFILWPSLHPRLGTESSGPPSIPGWGPRVGWGSPAPWCRPWCSTSWAGWPSSSGSSGRLMGCG
jgi:heme exporter protein C